MFSCLGFSILLKQLPAAIQSPHSHVRLHCRWKREFKSDIYQFEHFYSSSEKDAAMTRVKRWLGEQFEQKLPPVKLLSQFSVKSENFSLATLLSSRSGNFCLLLNLKLQFVNFRPQHCDSDESSLEMIIIDDIFHYTVAPHAHSPISFA